MFSQALRGCSRDSEIYLLDSEILKVQPRYRNLRNFETSRSSFPHFDSANHEVCILRIGSWLWREYSLHAPLHSPLFPFPLIKHPTHQITPRNSMLHASLRSLQSSYNTDTLSPSSRTRLLSPSLQFYLLRLSHLLPSQNQ